MDLPKIMYVILFSISESVSFFMIQTLAHVLSNFFHHIFDIILWKHFLEYLQKVNLRVLFGSTYEFLGKFSIK